MKKVLILTYHLDLGGVEKAAVNLANDLSSRGYDVILYSIYKFYPEKFEISQDVQCENYFGFYFKGLDRVLPKFFKRKIAKEIEKFADLDYLISFQPGLPHEIVDLVDTKVLKYTWFHGIGFEIDESYSSYDRIFFVGKDIKNHYFSNHELSKEKIQQIYQKSHVIYNVIVEKDILSQSKQEVSELKKEKDKFTFISVGRLSPEKQFDLLIQQFEIIYESSRGNARLVIVGSGPEEEKLKQLIEKLGLIDSISLVGYQKNPYKFLKEADIYVCSSAYEGFNIAMTEAAVLGLPIVSTNVYGAKELLGDKNQYGLVVEEDKDLAIAMKKMMNSDTQTYYRALIRDRIKHFYPDNSTDLLEKYMLEDRRKRID